MSDNVPEFGRRPVDPDLGTGVPAASDFDDIAAELQSDPELVQFVELEVPGRPRYGIRARLDFDRNDMQRWQNASRDSRFEQGFDGVKMNTLLIGSVSTILRDGEPLVISGQPVSFQSPAFQQTVGAGSVAEAVSKLYGGARGEAAITMAADTIMKRAGWGEVARELDPTRMAKPRG